MQFIKGMLAGAGLVAGTAMIMGAAQPDSFDTIDVKRINVRENDGTLRLVIAGRDNFPGSFRKGEEIARPDRTDLGGMLFVNDEGTENGGLVWKGSATTEGKRDAAASLTFDRYENDQTLQLLQTDAGATDTSALILSDRPAEPIDHGMLEQIFAADSQDEQLRLAKDANIGGAMRVMVGRTKDRESQVSLRDSSGTPRLVLRVEADGAARIEFLDEQGQVTRSISGNDAP
ncbi:MAG: hypothetical protein DI637_08790 [Citromicrobium sp.]|nr:MAG: hypothetical protein DI637_08790 [Citromicrobium sp.]